MHLPSQRVCGGFLFGVYICQNSGEDFDQPVGCEAKAVLDFAVVVCGNVAPLEDGDVRNERANRIAEGTAEFEESVGALFGLSDGVDFVSETALQDAVLSLG